MSYTPQYVSTHSYLWINDQYYNAQGKVTKMKINHTVTIELNVTEIQAIIELYNEHASLIDSESIGDMPNGIEPIIASMCKAINYN